MTYISIMSDRLWRITDRLDERHSELYAEHQDGNLTHEEYNRAIEESVEDYYEAVLAYWRSLPWEDQITCYQMMADQYIVEEFLDSVQLSVLALTA